MTPVDLDWWNSAFRDKHKRRKPICDCCFSSLSGQALHHFSLFQTQENIDSLLRIALEQTDLRAIQIFFGLRELSWWFLEAMQVEDFAFLPQEFQKPIQTFFGTQRKQFRGLVTDEKHFRPTLVSRLPPDSVGLIAMLTIWALDWIQGEGKAYRGDTVSNVTEAIHEKVTWFYRQKKKPYQDIEGSREQILVSLSQCFELWSPKTK